MTGGCQIPGCDRQHSARGYCKKHYELERRASKRTGIWTTRPYGPRGVCQFPECGRPHSSRGFCRGHYEQQRTGRALTNLPTGKRRLPGPWLNKDGYVCVQRDGKRMLEHRLVMAEIIGRELHPWETPHHMNGIRHDNSPGNLQLWVKPQPAGQRASDLAAWVVEYYPELVEAALADRSQLRFAS